MKGGGVSRIGCWGDCPVWHVMGKRAYFDVYRAMDCVHGIVAFIGLLGNDRKGYPGGALAMVQ